MTGVARPTCSPVSAKAKILLADRGYDSDALRARLAEQGAWGNIKPMPHRVNVPSFSPYLYRFRNLVECFFNKLKHFRAVATRYEKHDANYLALVKLAAIRIWFRFMSWSRLIFSVAISAPFRTRRYSLCFTSLAAARRQTAQPPRHHSSAVFFQAAVRLFFLVSGCLGDTLDFQILPPHGISNGGLTPRTTSTQIAPFA